MTKKFEAEKAERNGKNRIEKPAINLSNWRQASLVMVIAVLFRGRRIEPGYLPAFKDL